MTCLIRDGLAYRPDAWRWSEADFRSRDSMRHVAPLREEMPAERARMCHKPTCGSFTRASFATLIRVYTFLFPGYAGSNREA